MAIPPRWNTLSMGILAGRSHESSQLHAFLTVGEPPLLLRADDHVRPSGEGHEPHSLPSGAVLAISSVWKPRPPPRLGFPNAPILARSGPPKYIRRRTC